MANPPYTGFIVVVRENADGGNVKAYVFTDLPEGASVPPKSTLVGLEQTLFNAIDIVKAPKDVCFDRNFANRTVLKTRLGELVDFALPDTPAS